MGFDLATVDVPEGTIPNGATGASVCLGTDGDTYFFGGIVFDTLIRAPNVEISKVADRPSAGPGDTVTYTTTVTNPQRSPDDPLYPTAAATNLVVADPLPSGLDFTGFTDSPPCTYNAATRTINCNVGTLPANGSFTYSFTATVDASAEGPAPNPVVNTAASFQLRGSTGRRLHRLRLGDDHRPATTSAATTAGRSGRRQDRLRQHRGARRHDHLEDGRDQLRAGHLDGLRARRSAPAGRLVRQRRPRARR